MKPQDIVRLNDQRSDVLNQKVIYPDLSNKRILIVEDTEHSYILLRTFLKKTNASVLHAETATQAKDILSEQPDIDLILMDIKLPDESGLELTSSLKKVYPAIPIIAQTAYAMTNDRDTCIRAGCDDYLSKPINKSHFIQAVRKQLNVVGIS